jgi:hypothetical protein
MEDRPLGAGSVDRFISSREVSTSSRSSGGRSGYFEENMAEGIVVNSSGVPQKLLEIKCPVEGKLNKKQSTGLVQNMLKQF